MNALAETVIDTCHYTDDLFSFATTRSPGFRFRSGEFAMLGLKGEDGRPILRAYSIASPSWADRLEFFSIKVPNGPLTSRLKNITPGDEIILRPKSTGTLVLDALRPGRRLWLIATGTGIAPFASVARDPETYERFDEVILTHTTRTNAELQFGYDLIHTIATDDMVAEMVGGSLTHFASVTREAPAEGVHTGRITHLIETGALFDALGKPSWDSQTDRVMICGSSPMIADTKALADAAGLMEGANNAPGDYVVEKAFAG